MLCSVRLVNASDGHTDPSQDAEMRTVLAKYAKGHSANENRFNKALEDDDEEDQPVSEVCRKGTLVAKWSAILIGVILFTLLHSIHRDNQEL